MAGRQAKKKIDRLWLYPNNGQTLIILLGLLVLWLFNTNIREQRVFVVVVLSPPPPPPPSSSSLPPPPSSWVTGRRYSLSSIMAECRLGDRGSPSALALWTSMINRRLPLLHATLALNSAVLTLHTTVLSSAVCTSMSDWLLSLLHTTTFLDQQRASRCQTGYCHFCIPQRS